MGVFDCSIWIFFVSVDVLFEVAMVTSSSDVEKHLSMGKQMLARGQLQDAITHFHAAVEGDPKNYMTYYQRATVFLAMGKQKAALPDLDKVLELQPDFTSARTQRANVLMKLGHLDEAHIDYERVLRKDPQNEDVRLHYSAIDELKQDVQHAYYAMKRKDYEGVIKLLEKPIEMCPWDSTLREMRADSYEGLGDLVKAISDLRTTVKLVTDNTAGHLRVARLHYQLGEADQSLSEVRECLKLDPDHKDCFAHYKKVKKLAKVLQDLQEFQNEQKHDECIAAAKKVLKLEPTTDMFRFQAKEKLCHCYLKNNEPTESISDCSDALKINEEPRILCDRADAYIMNEMFEEALRDFQHAAELDENMQRAKDGIEKTRKLQKQAKKRDYYKILGVRRTAGKREISKAYRKLAQKWHPDNFQNNPEELEMAEKKFIDIAAAKEVLMDPEKRQKFDQGEDPLDPDTQAGQGFNPFAHGFNPFRGGGGGPFQFKFHFN